MLEARLLAADGTSTWQGKTGANNIRTSSHKSLHHMSAMRSGMFNDILLLIVKQLL